MLPQEECFGQIPRPFSGGDQARIVVVPAPYEATTTYMTGTALGPAAILKASSQVELYDEELDCEPYRQGIATLEPLHFSEAAPEAALSVIEESIASILDEGRFPFMLGGEHTVTLGGLRACKERFADLGIIHLDAHADLRESYEGLRFSHATVLRRATELCPALALGIRSMSVEEAAFAASSERVQILTAARLLEGENWEDLLAGLPQNIYLTLDLDVMDPPEMPAVGTPEPGGPGWYHLNSMLKRIIATGRIKAMDMVELCPPAGPAYASFTAARLAYRLMGRLLQ